MEEQKEVKETKPGKSASSADGPKRPKMKGWKKFFIWLGSIIGSVILIILLVAGWFGFVPILSDIMGANSPRDLGIKTTQADYAPAIAKSGVTLSQLPAGTLPEQSIQYSGKITTKTEFTSEDLTAMAAYRNWIYTLTINPQIRINADGTMESSGNLNLATAEHFALAYGVAQSQIDQAKTFLGLIKTNPAYYVKIQGGVANGRFNVDVLEASIGRFNLPANWFSKYRSDINSFADTCISSVPGMYIRSAQDVAGKLKVDLDLPATISTVHK